MPRFPNRTVAVAVNRLSPNDDEDNDICPVCDGDCTCDNRPRPLFPPNVGHGNARFVATPTASTASSGRALGAQPLKIKLIVPPSIQNKARSLGSAPKKSRTEDVLAAPNGVAGSSSAPSHLTSASSTAGHGQHSISNAIGPKCKGCPSKVVATARDVVSDQKNRSNEANTLPQSQSHLSSRTHTQRSVTSRATRPQVETFKSNSAASRQTSKSQAKGTIAKRSASTKKQDFFSDLINSDLQSSGDTPHDDDGDDASSGRFPTFVSADGLTSEASDSSASDSDSDASGFGSDSSLAAEEENYILTEQRRHDKARVRRELLGDDVPKHKDSNNSWVIRPRKRSVGLSDVDMEGDTNVTEEDEDEDDEMEDDEDEEDDETDGQASRVYTGLATGWSDDEESSFDADLFFANLTDTSSDDDSSDSNGSHPHGPATDPLANSITSLRSVDFEVTEAWDGQVVFTNGSNDGHGVLDLAFEANAAQLLAPDSASISQDSDVEMRTSDGADDGFDDGDSQLGASDGDTTEEELVDEQGLPTSRAMRPFQWPTSVSFINPMSTVSPNVSPAPFSRRHPLSTMLESPRPADILAGKVLWEETDQPQQDSPEGGAGESPRPVVGSGIPIMGQFSLGGNAQQKTAVLTGANKDVPSPYPCRYRRRRFSSSAGSFSSMDLRGRTARLSIYPSLPPPPDEPASEAPPDISLGESIKLDDVLDSTFLDSEPENGMSTIPDGDGEQKLAQSLSRWDRVPVGAFRLTRESAASASDVPTSPGWTSEPAKLTVPEVQSYQNALKSSPLHTMLWNDKCRTKENPRKSRGVIISPVLLPVRDGDRTPTHVPHHHDLHTNHRQQHTPFKNRKESRREVKMMKRKTHGPNRQQDQHQRHHRRNHHPNMKSRGNASVQRTFFSSPTSAPALNI